MPLIAFDSNICIWCIKEECTPGQEPEMQAAIKLRKLLTKAGYDILIPIPVVSELLSNISEVAQRQEFFNEIRKIFQIGEFDAKAALLLGEILNYHYITSNKLYKTLGISKTALKYDSLIVATSIAHGAECLYAYDPDCKKIAVHFLPVKSLNERPDSITQNIGMYEGLSEKEIAKQVIRKTLEEFDDEIDNIGGGATIKQNSPLPETNNKKNDEQVKNKEESSTETSPGELPTETGD